MSEDKEIFDEADKEETAVTVDDQDKVKKDDDEYEKICFMCRRPESKA